MKKTELKEIKTLGVKELAARIGKAKSEIAGLVIERNGQASAKGAKDTKMAAKKRRDIAQMFTILRQKQLLEELGSRAATPAAQEKVEVKKEPIKVKKNVKKQTANSNNEKKVRDGQSNKKTASKTGGRTGLSK